MIDDAAIGGCAHFLLDQCLHGQHLLGRRPLDAYRVARFGPLLLRPADDAAELPVVELHAPAEGRIGVGQRQSVFSAAQVGAHVGYVENRVARVGIFQRPRIVEHQHPAICRRDHLGELVEADGDAEDNPIAVEQLAGRMAECLVALAGGARPVAVELHLANRPAAVVRGHGPQALDNQLGILGLPAAHRPQGLEGDIDRRDNLHPVGDRRGEAGRGNRNRFVVPGFGRMLGRHVEHPQIDAANVVAPHKGDFGAVGRKGRAPMVDGAGVLVRQRAGLRRRGRIGEGLPGLLPTGCDGA